jgi:hypothetical protein
VICTVIKLSKWDNWRNPLLIIQNLQRNRVCIQVLFLLVESFFSVVCVIIRRLRTFRINANINCHWTHILNYGRRTFKSFMYPNLHTFLPDGLFTSGFPNKILYAFPISIRHAWLYKCIVRAMQKKLKLGSNGGDSGSKTCKRGYGGAYGGVWRSLRLAGVWSSESGGWFYVGAFDRNLA